MNILFFTESGLGIGALVTDQICELKKLHSNTFGVVSSKEQEEGLIKRMEEANIPLLHLKDLESHIGFWRHVKLLRKYVLDNEINIIHTQTNWELVMSYIVKLSLLFTRKLKLVYTVHAFRNNDQYKKYVALIIINLLLLLLADRVICTCRYTQRQFPLVRYKMLLIPLGIDARFFREKWEYAKNACLSMMFPAQFRAGKQQDIIIKAFAKYVDKTGDTSSVVILPGEGPLLEKMRELACSLGIGDRVKMPGFCRKEEVCNMFARVNIAVISSNNETFGQCIVEPFVMGKLILSTPVGIAPELIGNGEGGYIFKTEDDLCDILCKIRENKEIIRHIGMKNYESRMRFSWGVITKTYIEELRQL